MHRQSHSYTVPNCKLQAIVGFSFPKGMVQNVTQMLREGQEPVAGNNVINLSFTAKAVCLHKKKHRKSSLTSLISLFNASHPYTLPYMHATTEGTLKSASLNY